MSSSERDNGSDRPRIDRGLRARLRRRWWHHTGQGWKIKYDHDRRLTMGRHSYFRPRVAGHWADTARVTTGAFCGIADDAVMMPGAQHPTEWVSMYGFRPRFNLPGAYEDGLPASKGDIVIGNDVTIYWGAKVLSGVTIADGAVVGAYSVVAKDVRPYAIVAGNPAREIRRRFSDEQIEALLRIRWWEWPDEKILEAVPLLNGGSIEQFLDRYDPARALEAQLDRRQ